MTTPYTLPYEIAKGRPNLSLRLTSQTRTSMTSVLLTKIFTQNP